MEVLTQQELELDGVFAPGSNEYKRLQKPFSQLNWIPAVMPAFATKHHVLTN